MGKPELSCFEVRSFSYNHAFNQEYYPSTSGIFPDWKSS